MEGTFFTPHLCAVGVLVLHALYTGKSEPTLLPCSHDWSAQREPC